MSLNKLFKGIQTAPSSSKHNRPGWINIQCPYCRISGKYHLGYNIANQYFNCFNCGEKPLFKTFIKITGLTVPELKTLLKQAKKGHKSTAIEDKPKLPFKKPTRLLQLKNCKNHQNYLRERSFNWLRLVKKYHIRATGVLSNLDNIDLSWRIFIPIYFQNEIVTWQTRSIGKSNVPYLACPEQYEKRSIKSLLYPEETNHTVFLTEGLFDCWKVREAGFPAVCGFGVNLKDQQIKLLSQKRVIVFYDGDQAGIDNAKIIKDRIEFITGNYVEIADCPKGKDPGGLTTKQINKILKGFL